MMKTKSLSPFNPNEFTNDLKVITDHLQSEGWYYAEVINRDSNSIVTYGADRSSVKIHIKIKYWIIFISWIFYAPFFHVDCAAISNASLTRLRYPKLCNFPLRKILNRFPLIALHALALTVNNRASSRLQSCAGRSAMTNRAGLLLADFRTVFFVRTQVGNVFTAVLTGIRAKLYISHCRVTSNNRWMVRTPAGLVHRWRSLIIPKKQTTITFATSPPPAPPTPS
jgi:hypothetical protein